MVAMLVPFLAVACGDKEEEDTSADEVEEAAEDTSAGEDSGESEDTSSAQE
tara:strand:+ start:47 stop:199 length:153 start_codon:yes stop_codon:yes gene_type:complete